MDITTTFNRYQLHKNLAIDLDGTFQAKIEAEVTSDIAIDRHSHFRRDGDVERVIFSIPSGAVEVAGDCASGDFDESQPTMCTFLDAFYPLLTIPERFGKEFPGSRERAEVA